jgi:hypothetical protein
MVAIELLSYVEQAHKNSPQSPLFAELKADVVADREELKSIMDRLGVRESRPRKVAGWLTEKITQIKLRFDDPSEGLLRLLEAIEAVAVGIEGKYALWGALQVAAATIPELQSIDYKRLAQRARDQRSRIEPARLQAARNALRHPIES